MITVVNHWKVSQIASPAFKETMVFKKLKHHELPHGFIASRFKKNKKLAIFTLTYNDYTITVNCPKTSQIASSAF